jgi:hypothetical protein
LCVGILHSRVDKLHVRIGHLHGGVAQLHARARRLQTRGAMPSGLVARLHSQLATMQIRDRASKQSLGANPAGRVSLFSSGTMQLELRKLPVILSEGRSLPKAEV